VSSAGRIDTPVLAALEELASKHTAAVSREVKYLPRLQPIPLGSPGILMSSKTSNDGANQSRPSETTSNPQSTDNPKLADTLRIDTPLQNQDPTNPPPPRTRDAITSDLALLSLLLRSNRVSIKDYMAYHKLQYTRLSVASINSNINFRHVASSAVQEVFNTAELLEMILLALPTGYLYARAQLACRGFKNAMEASPEFQRRMAVAMRGVDPNPSFAWSVAPKCMDFHYAVKGRAVFKFTFTELSCERHLFMERFRRLAISDTTPQRLEVLWYECEDFYEHREFEEALWTRMIWISSMSATGSRDGWVTFGSVFDEVARRVPVGRSVGGMLLFLRVGGEAREGPFFADREERDLRARST